MKLLKKICSLLERITKNMPIKEERNKNIAKNTIANNQASRKKHKVVSNCKSPTFMIPKSLIGYDEFVITNKDGNLFIGGMRDNGYNVLHPLSEALLNKISLMGYKKIHLVKVNRTQRDWVLYALKRAKYTRIITKKIGR